jgi:hypothetical protein
MYQNNSPTLLQIFSPTTSWNLNLISLLCLGDGGLRLTNKNKQQTYTFAPVNYLCMYLEEWSHFGAKDSSRPPSSYVFPCRYMCRRNCATSVCKWRKGWNTSPVSGWYTETCQQETACELIRPKSITQELSYNAPPLPWQHTLHGYGMTIIYGLVVMAMKGYYMITHF